MLAIIFVKRETVVNRETTKSPDSAIVQFLTDALINVNLPPLLQSLSTLPATHRGLSHFPHLSSPIVDPSSSHSQKSRLLPTSLGAALDLDHDRATFRVFLYAELCNL